MLKDLSIVFEKSCLDVGLDIGLGLLFILMTV
jgi:hypothetical protein